MGFLLKDLTDVQLKMQNKIWKKGEEEEKKTGVWKLSSPFCVTLI